MKKLIITGLLVLTGLPFTSSAQVSVKATAGLSFIEHFSIGNTLQFAEQHNLSLLYGSNFFFHPAKFSSLLFQYDKILIKRKFAGITPVVGLKSGYSIYTNNYYKWKLLTLIPFVGVRYPLNNRLDLFADLGCTGSFELSVQRISFGEIGNYKTLLPEFKAGIMYTIFQK